MQRVFVASFLALLLALAGCRTPPSSAPSEWHAWHAKRLRSVAGTHGWTTVVGLHWLAEGSNPTGTAPGLPVPLPAGRGPEHVGDFVRTGQQVHFEARPGVTVTLSNQPVTSVVLQSDEDGHATPSPLRVGDLTLTLLKRGARLGIRVRDPESSARRHFKGLARYRYDPRWRLPARYVAFPEPRQLKVPDVTGNIQSLASPGQLVFSVAGSEHRLDVVEEPGEEEFFILFRDATSGRGTYGAGRYLYAPRPDARGAVLLDFNHAYTPPCGFTAFATCPMPPPQNRLPFPIRAGERAPAGHP